MPMFICDVCSGVENTARGFTDYTNSMIRWDNPALNGKMFCSECIPAEPDIDGDVYYRYTGGKWHGEFPKEIATEEMVRERGNWLEHSDLPGAPRGFIYYGKFEYLPPELKKRLQKSTRQRRAAKRKAKEGL